MQMENNKPRWRGNSFQSLSEWTKTQKIFEPQNTPTKPGNEPKGVTTPQDNRLKRKITPCGKTSASGGINAAG